MTANPFEGTKYSRLATNYSTHEGKFDSSRVKFLVYGESGVGKTVFASTWPKPVFLDIDKGMSSVKREVHRIEINCWEDLVESLTFLSVEQHPFQTVVLDSLNELQYLTMRNVISSYPGIRRSYESLPSVSDYGKMLDDFDARVRDLKALPLNIIFIAQVAPRAYETDPVQPQFTGKSTARNLSRMMDIVGYLDKRESSEGHKTRLMVFDAVNYVTKDRSDLLPQSVENPTYETLMKFWKRGEKVEE